jgi:hypothetical protein
VQPYQRGLRRLKGERRRHLTSQPTPRSSGDCEDLDPGAERLIDTKDPRGLRIRCDGEWWRVHVVDRKPEFANDDMLRAVCLALSDPDCITAAKNHPRRECYYRPAPWPYGTQLAKVVVEFARLGKRGMVITCDRVPAVTYGERTVWRRP